LIFDVFVCFFYIGKDLQVKVEIGPL
jgi:hypothetical protein